jgi:ferritin
MSISAKTLEALNRQVGMEFAASLKYDSIASYFAAESLPRLAAFYYQQSTEERMHAHRIIKFILDVGGRVRIPAIGETPWNFKTAEVAVKTALDSELNVTKSINSLVELAQKEKDYATSNMLLWFVTEQVEEVAQAEQMLRIMQRAGEEGLLLVEEYIAQMPEGGGGKR